MPSGVGMLQRVYQMLSGPVLPAALLLAFRLAAAFDAAHEALFQRRVGVGHKSRDDAFDRLRSREAVAVRVARGEVGMQLLIEPINTRTVPGFFLTGSRQAIDVLNAAGEGNAFLQYASATEQLDVNVRLLKLPILELDNFIKTYAPFDIEAGPDLDTLTPLRPGDAWGAPWDTTWLRLRGEIPDEWSSRRVEAVIDLGFHPNAAGFQCEKRRFSVRKPSVRPSLRPCVTWPLIA